MQLKGCTLAGRGQDVLYVYWHVLAVKVL